MSDLLRLSSICNRVGVPVIDQPQLVYILTELLPGTSMSDLRLPLNFALVLDRSGSMAGEKLKMMKDAVKNIISQLSADDIVSIVTFETKTQVLIEAQPAANKDEIKSQVEKIRDGGGTNMAPAIQEGLRLVGKNLGPERVTRLVLLTDGEATDNEDDSRNLANLAGTQGIRIIGLGFGKDWNEDFLFDLADRSVLSAPGSRMGRADYIPTPEDANKIFQDVYQSMQVVAKNALVTIRMVQGIEARRIWQVTPLIKDLGKSVIQGRAVVVPVGELEKSGAAYLAEIMLPPRTQGAVRIAQTDVTYEIPNAEQKREAVDLIVNYSSDPAINNQVNGRVMNVIEKVQAFKLQTQALDEADTGNVQSATQKLRQAVTILLSQGETDLASQMKEEAERLEQSGELSTEGKKTIKLTSRKTVRLTDDE
jgi:Ca-activated chloride channel homolog